MLGRCKQFQPKVYYYVNYNAHPLYVQQRAAVVIVAVIQL